jgi:hypothetical protein
MNQRECLKLRSAAALQFFVVTGRPTYRLPGLLDHVLTRNSYDSQQYDGFPFQNQSLNK